MRCLVILGLVLLQPLAALSAEGHADHGSAEGQAVQGTVVDAQTGIPLAGANVVVIGTRTGGIVDVNGRFRIGGLEPGEVTLRASLIGYRPQEKTVELPTGAKVKVSFELSETALRGDEVVVTATRTEKFKRDVPVIVGIVDEEIFEASLSETVAEGVVFQPALRVETNCQNCGFTQLRMNGLEGGYSQILIDGRPVFSALDGVYGLEQIPTSMIDQIEVIRGGGSALYGGNAIAGTVNLVTREAINTGFEVSVSNAYVGGETPDRTVNVTTSFVTDDQRTGLTLFGVLRDRSPYFHDSDDYSELVQIHNNSFGLRSHFRPSALSKLSLEFHSLSEERRGGNRFEFQPHEADIAEWLEHRVVGASVAYESALSTTGTNEVEFYASAKRTERDSYYGAGRDPNAYGASLDRTVAVGGRYTRAVSGSQELTFGTDIKYNRLHDEIPSYSRVTDQSVMTVGVYGQTDWQPSEAFNVLLGARMDRHSLMDDPVISPRANLLVDLTERSQLRLSGSSGFRAPQTFDEDLHIESVGGNALLIQLSPDLGPERSWSASGSYDFTFDEGGPMWGATLEGFYTAVDDAFVLEEAGTDADGNLILTKKNGDGAVVKGVTLDVRATNPTGSIQGGLTVQSSRYDSPVEWADGLFSYSILRTPRVYGYWAAIWKATEAFSLSVSGTYTGPMDVPHYAGFIAEDRMERSAPFWETNLTADFGFQPSKMMPELELKVGVKNLFNEYQNDFDQGIDRDAGYVYGPRLPRMFVAAVKVAY